MAGANAGSERGAGPGAASTASPRHPPLLLPSGGAAPERRGAGGGGGSGRPARPGAGQRGARPRTGRCQAHSTLLLLGVVAGWCALGSHPLVHGAPAVPKCPLDGRPVVELQTALDAGASDDAEPVFCMQGNGTGTCTECQRTYCEITAEHLDYQDWQMLMTGVPNSNYAVAGFPDDVASSYEFFSDETNSYNSFLFSMVMRRASRVVLPDVNYTASTPASEYVADCMRSLENTTLTGPTAPELVDVVRGKDGICVEFNEPGVLNGSSTLGENVSGGAVRWGTAS